jgi:hypothetical protein
MSSAAGAGGGEITHCEWCGAEFPPDTPSPPRRPPEGPAPPAAPARGTEAEPATHCEWCGAEYPVPGDEAG